MCDLNIHELISLLPAMLSASSSHTVEAASPEGAASKAPMSGEIGHDHGIGAYLNRGLSPLPPVTWCW
jgi:hypothetical protein